MPRTYVDNAYNRGVGRVGLNVGSAVISQNTVCGMNTKSYVDNAYNRQHERVGMSHGSAVVSKYSDGLTSWNYLDIDRQSKQVSPSKIKSSFIPKHTEHTKNDVKHAWRDSDVARFDTKIAPRNRTNVPKSRERWRTNSSSSEFSTDLDRFEEDISAEELNKTESEIAVTSPYLSILKDRDIQELVRCRVCHTGIKSSSLAPCGHHFCTNCILQWLERKQSCPLCKARLSESNLIQDKEFDRIIGQYKHEIKQLKSQIKELKENKRSQEAKSKKTEDISSQLATQLKEKTKQNQQLTDQLDKERRKNTGLQNQTDKKVRQCDDHKEELYELKENFLPEKERMIAQLSNQLKKRQYGPPEFARKHSGLVKENASLHKNAIEHEEEMNRQKRELRQSKANIHELERKCQLERNS